MKLTLTDDAMGAYISAQGSKPTRNRVGIQLRIDVTAIDWRLSATSSPVTSAARVPEIVVCWSTGSVPALS
jgi:hypothetical protein